MTRPKMPPTPASSTEIKGQDHSNKLSSLQLTFELPPSAMPSNEALKPASTGTKMSPVSPTSKAPYLQPSETVKARRRSTTAQQKETFALPPPPTRSRKIIQMKPRPQEEEAVAPSPAKGATAAGSNAKNAAGSGVAAPSKTTTKKQPSATSAAGRKIARKTAHSLIERRRRSKMNEEFAVLKGLIPACTGEMHKLAILQASIEYVRYLEDCIAKLKAQHGESSAGTTPTEFRPMQRVSHDDEDWSKPTEGDEDGGGGGGGGGDVEMTDTETPSPTFTAAVPPRPSVSPLDRHHSYSSASTDYQLYAARGSVSGPGSVSGSGSASGSGSVSVSGMSPPSYAYPPESTLASPPLRPQLEIDHEVSAALLMLGGGRGTSSARGMMSVRDLLSS